VLRTLDSGANWTMEYSGVGEDLMGLDFRPDGTLGCCCGRNGTILLTTDRGTSWARAELVGV